MWRLLIVIGLAGGLLVSCRILPVSAVPVAKVPRAAGVMVPAAEREGVGYVAAARRADDPMERLGWCLRAMEALPPEERRWREEATEMAAAVWPARRVEVATGGRRWEVSASPMPGVVLSAASAWRVSGPMRHYRTRGAGVPMLCGPMAERDAMPGGLWVNRTAFVSVHGGAARLELVDPADPKVAGNLMAADYTLGWARMFGLAGGMDRRKLPDVFRPGGNEAGPKIYRLAPWDPDKRILLMVHGIFDTPQMWRGVVNGLFRDPEIAANYQPWVFAWPTGLPLLPAAAALRREFDAALAAADPGGRTFAARHVTVAGHSMGGLLARTMSSDSGEAVWRAMFTLPPEDLPVDADDREVLREACFFRPDARVERVVFLCVPHRGSGIASSVIGSTLAKLQDIPMSVAGPLLRLLTLNPEVIQPEVLGGAFLPLHASIPDLSPHSPVLRALQACPLTKEHHSIIALRFPWPARWNSDGAVSWRSAHLASADSETLVRGGHQSYTDRRCLEAMRRILTEPLHQPVP